jgi:hypothetical protein
MMTKGSPITSPQYTETLEVKEAPASEPFF